MKQKYALNKQIKHNISGWYHLYVGVVVMEISTTLHLFEVLHSQVKMFIDCKIRMLDKVEGFINAF